MKGLRKHGERRSFHLGVILFDLGTLERPFILRQRYDVFVILEILRR